MPTSAQTESRTAILRFTLSPIEVHETIHPERGSADFIAFS
jgi:hypothetical protein